MEYTRNYNPNYYEECQHYANCGSFAFQIEEWYSPDEDFENNIGLTIDEWIEQGKDNGWDEYDMSDWFTEMLTDCILNDFEDVRCIDCASELEPNEELILFRTFIDYDNNWDFHFKVLRNGMWLEKCGGDPVRFCDKDDWHNGCMEYTSIIVYFARKLES